MGTNITKSNRILETEGGKIWSFNHFLSVLRPPYKNIISVQQCHMDDCPWPWVYDGHTFARGCHLLPETLLDIEYYFQILNNLGILIMACIQSSN